MTDQKQTLHRYLDQGHEALLWKVEGLDEHDLRRPMTPTGTNLLGLVKHTAATGVGYFGEVFGRPFPEPIPWFEDDAPDNADMFATAEESPDELLALDARCWAHSGATIAALDLDFPGVVPWWPEERRHVTLQQILVHMTAELHRHVGHADIIRELIDGAVGMREGNENLPEIDWTAHRARVETEARRAAGL